MRPGFDALDRLGIRYYVTGSGTTLRVTIPLAYLGDPETLSLGLMRVVGLDATASEGDFFPNEQDTCVPVPLPVERADG